MHAPGTPFNSFSETGVDTPGLRNENVEHKEKVHTGKFKREKKGSLGPRGGRKGDEAVPVVVVGEPAFGPKREENNVKPEVQSAPQRDNTPDRGQRTGPFPDHKDDRTVRGVIVRD